MAEQARLDLIADTDDSVADTPCDADMAALNALIETAPTTFAGLLAWASYLDEIGEVEAWMLEDRAQALIATLAEALGNLAVAS